MQDLLTMTHNTIKHFFYILQDKRKRDGVSSLVECRTIHGEGKEGASGSRSRAAFCNQPASPEPLTGAPLIIIIIIIAPNPGWAGNIAQEKYCFLFRIIACEENGNLYCPGVCPLHIYIIPWSMTGEVFTISLIAHWKDSNSCIMICFPYGTSKCSI